MATILFSGLTHAHEVLMKGFFEHLGYDVERLPEPDNESLRVGKIFCNKGQCNPVYYTAGNLIRHLQRLREGGVDGIERRFVYITAGSCGPCRFGMYETEYRKAVRDAGFGGLRIVALQQSQALLNRLEEAGFSLPRRAFYGLLGAFLAGDLVNNLFYKTKPYEARSGDVDRWKEESLSLVRRALREGSSIPAALRAVRRALDRVELDPLRPKPLVKITGEFFTQTQEGEANYRLPSWLLEEGAEPAVEPLATWLDYLIWVRLQSVRERSFRSPLRSLKTMGLLFALKSYVRLRYRRYRRALGGRPDPLSSQRKLADYAAPYFHPRLVGGEGHLEVGKRIQSTVERKAHLVVSVKPFGCMCSTQSDGVQTKVTHDLEGSLFVTVDTSGDAEVNFKSRVLMQLTEAKRRAREEFDTAMRELGIDERGLEELRSVAGRSVRGSTRLAGGGISTASRALRRAARIGRRLGAGPRDRL